MGEKKKKSKRLKASVMELVEFKPPFYEARIKREKDKNGRR
jgi:hypothetical protein